MKRIVPIFIILFLSLNSFAADSDQLYKSGLQAIERDDYVAAISKFKQAIKGDPTKADYHRWLGRSYGLHAEEVAWYSKIKLANKARDSFEKAVEVEPENINALLDLRGFYTRAPSIVGGSQEKADLITKRLQALGYDE